MVSPQFHVKMDPTFRSIDPSLGQQWISKAGLDTKTSRGRKDAHSKRKRQAEEDLLREGALTRKKFAVQAKPEHKDVEATLEANKDKSNNQPDNDAGTQTNHKILDTTVNITEPARPTGPDKETGKNTVESTLLQDNRRDNEVQEIFALTTMFGKGLIEDHEDPLMIYKEPATLTLCIITKP